MKIPLSEITVGTRHRKDLGDLEAFSHSIRTLGLLQPIGVDSQRQLVWGQRRLEACRMLGWHEIDAVVDPSFDDMLRAMKAEQDENRCRLPFSPSECAAIADQIEALEQEQSRQRQLVGQRASAQNTNRKRGRASGDETITQVIPNEISVGADSAPTDSGEGKTRDKVAAAVGMSHDTLTKARQVMARGTPELIAAMDSGQASISAAAKIADLPPAKQRAIVAGGKEAITKAAQPARRPRRPKLHQILDRLDELASMHPTMVSLAALHEALKDLRQELGALLA